MDGGPCEDITRKPSIGRQDDFPKPVKERKPYACRAPSIEGGQLGVATDALPGAPAWQGPAPHQHALRAVSGDASQAAPAPTAATYPPPGSSSDSFQPGPAEAAWPTTGAEATAPPPPPAPWPPPPGPFVPAPPAPAATPLGSVPATQSYPAPPPHLSLDAASAAASPPPPPGPLPLLDATGLLPAAPPPAPPPTAAPASVAVSGRRPARHRYAPSTASSVFDDSDDDSEEQDLARRSARMYPRITPAAVTPVTAAGTVTAAAPAPPPVAPMTASAAGAAVAAAPDAPLILLQQLQLQVLQQQLLLAQHGLLGQPPPPVPPPPVPPPGPGPLLPPGLSPASTQSHTLTQRLLQPQQQLPGTPLGSSWTGLSTAAASDVTSTAPAAAAGPGPASAPAQPGGAAAALLPLFGSNGSASHAFPPQQPPPSPPKQQPQQQPQQLKEEYLRQWSKVRHITAMAPAAAPAMMAAAAAAGSTAGSSVGEAVPATAAAAALGLRTGAAQAPPSAFVPASTQELTATPVPSGGSGTASAAAADAAVAASPRSQTGALHDPAALPLAPPPPSPLVAGQVNFTTSLPEAETPNPLAAAWPYQQQQPQQQQQPLPTVLAAPVSPQPLAPLSSTGEPAAAAAVAPGRGGGEGGGAGGEKDPGGAKGDRERERDAKAALPPSADLVAENLENIDALAIFEPGDEDDAEGGDPEEDEEDEEPTPRWYQRPPVLWFLSSVGLGLALLVVGLVLHNRFQSAQAAADAFRWCYFFAAMPLLYYALSYASRHVFMAIEWWFFRESLLYLLNVQRSALWLLFFLALLPWFCTVFRWAWCGTTDTQPRRCQQPAYVQATSIVWNILLCLMLFCLANLLKAVLAKLLTTHFYRTAHFKKLKSALEKEYALQVLSKPRRLILAERTAGQQQQQQQLAADDPHQGAWHHLASFLHSQHTHQHQHQQHHPQEQQQQLGRTLAMAGPGGDGAEANGGGGGGGSAASPVVSGTAGYGTGGAGPRPSAIPEALEEAEDEDNDGDVGRRSDRRGVAATAGATLYDPGAAVSFAAGVAQRPQSPASPPPPLAAAAPGVPSAPIHVSAAAAAAAAADRPLSAAALPPGSPSPTAALSRPSAADGAPPGQNPHPLHSPPPPPLLPTALQPPLPPPPPPPPGPPQPPAVSAPPSMSAALPGPQLQPPPPQQPPQLQRQSGPNSTGGRVSEPAGGRGPVPLLLLSRRDSQGSRASRGSAVRPPPQPQPLARAGTGTLGADPAGRKGSAALTPAMVHVAPPGNPRTAQRGLRHLSDAELEKVRTAIVIKTQSALITKYTDRSDEDMAKELGRVRRFAKALFFNVLPPDCGRDVLTPPDFLPFFEAAEGAAAASAVATAGGAAAPVAVAADAASGTAAAAAPSLPRESRGAAAAAAGGGGGGGDGKGFGRTSMTATAAADPARAARLRSRQRAAEAAAAKAFAVFDADGNGEVSRSEVREAVVNIYKERRNMARSLKDTETIVQSLEFGIGGVIHFVFAAVYLLIWGVDLLTGFSTFSATVLALTFVFGNSVKNMYESMLFLFVTHPYDVGDCIVLGTEMYRVKKISLLYTDMVKSNGERVYMPNTALISQGIINWTRSKSKSESCRLVCDIGVAWEVREDIQAALRAYAREHPAEFEGEPSCNFRELSDPLKVVLVCSWNYNFAPDDFPRLGPARNGMLFIVQSKAREHRLHHTTFTDSPAA